MFTSEERKDPSAPAKDEDVPFRLVHSSPKGISITLFFFNDDTDALLKSDLGGAILRIVVHDEDLVQSLLGLEILDNGSDRCFFVVCRDDEADAESFVHENEPPRGFF